MIPEPSGLMLAGVAVAVLSIGRRRNARGVKGGR
jgi:hypothetical protein